MSKSYDRYVEDEMDDDYSDPTPWMPDSNEVTMEEVLGEPKEKTMNMKNSMKNSVTVNRKAASASDLKIGQIGIATSYPNEGAVILCTYDGFVDLNNPNSTWQFGDFTVDILPDGSTVTITVGDKSNDEAIIDILKGGNLILAIKERREQSGEGLKESKEYVEALREKCYVDGTLLRPPSRF